MPSMPSGRPVASYPSYAEAQRAVDYLSDHKFPVKSVSIVGTDLNMVERVTGRLTYGRVAWAGALSGAYIGLFVGFLFALLEQRSFASTLLSTVAIGAGFGIIFGLVSYAMTGGRRDFTSTSQIVAAQYAVWCTEDHAGHAHQMLSTMTGAVAAGLSSPPAGNAPPPPGSPPPWSSPPGPSQGSGTPPWSPPVRPGGGSPEIRPTISGPRGDGREGNQSQPTSGGSDQPQSSHAPTGPTYGEMIARKKAEQERQQRESPETDDQRS